MALQKATKLRRYVAEKMTREGAPCSEEQVVITNGSQQGMDLVSKLFVNPGDVVLVEEPGYVGGLGQFSIMRLTVPIPLDNDGIRIDVLTNRLRKLKMEGRTPKFIYLVPNFRIPPVSVCLWSGAGRTELAREYNF